MTVGDVGWIVIVNGLVQLSGLLALGFLAVRGLRELREVARMTRAVAGLVHQESDTTRTRLDELLGPRSR